MADQLGCPLRQHIHALRLIDLLAHLDLALVLSRLGGGWGGGADVWDGGVDHLVTLPSSSPLPPCWRRRRHAQRRQQRNRRRKSWLQDFCRFRWSLSRISLQVWCFGTEISPQFHQVSTWLCCRMDHRRQRPLPGTAPHGAGSATWRRVRVTAAPSATWGRVPPGGRCASRRRATRKASRLIRWWASSKRWRKQNLGLFLCNWEFIPLTGTRQ